MTDPDTIVDQVFARVADPEPQEEISARRRAERFAGTCQWFMDTRSFIYGESASGPQATGVFFGVQGGQAMGKASFVGRSSLISMKYTGYLEDLALLTTFAFRSL